MVQSAVLGRQGPVVSDERAALRLPHGKRDRLTARAERVGLVVKGQPPALRVSRTQGEWPAVIFAAKTTAAALIALLVAFTFNLDEPYWALLTVFIVSQPLESGAVLAKSFYRIIGTLLGAAMSLLLVSLFAQERVLFLGALALWLGVCACGSQYARNFAAYSFVLSGYTAAIVGIPGALDPNNAFYIATGRITEICLGIIVAATMHHIVLPSSLTRPLRQAIDDARQLLADYAIALCEGAHTAPIRAKLFSQMMAVENLLASGIFESREIRERSDTFRALNIALIEVLSVGRQLREALSGVGRIGPATEARVEHAVAEGAAAIKSWKTAAIDAAEFDLGLARARAQLPPVQPLGEGRCVPDDETIRQIVIIVGLRDFFSALAAYAEAYESLASSEKPAARRIRFSRFNDPVGAFWTGVRAALAVFFVSAFWILVDWPHGSTAAVLGALATARLATMAPAVPIAAAGTMIFGLSWIPAFIVVDVLLPFADGFSMFALVVAPILFFYAFLMAHKRTMLIGYLSVLLFASAGEFTDRMTYDPVNLVNTTIAAVIAAATALVLWAIVAPATSQAARRRFVRAIRKALARIAAPRRQIQLDEYETAMTEALERLRGSLHDDRPQDAAMFEAGIALASAGRQLIRLRDGASSAEPAAVELAELLARQRPGWIERARHSATAAAAACLAELREPAADPCRLQSAVRKLVSFAAIRDELQHMSGLFIRERSCGVPSRAA